MVPLYQTTLRYSWQHSNFPHLLPQSELTEAPNDITWNIILTQMPVNKLIIFNGKPIPVFHTTACAVSNTTHYIENA
jgi:hypothetical protein